MTAKRVAPAKIARPSLSSVVPRERLYTLLDERTAHPIIWVSSPAGSGKTTLLSGYLQSRKIPSLWYRCDEGDSDPATFFYYMGLAAKAAVPRSGVTLPLLTPEYRDSTPAFAMRYFERLCSRLTGARRKEAAGRRFTIVLDNYQDVPSSSPLHHMVSSGLDAIPEGVRLVVMSRTDPPSQFARLQGNDKIYTIRYDDIRFTFEESWELVCGRVARPQREKVERMHKRTEGWAAGMILLLEGGLADPATDISDDRVFDYFAGEIFDRSERGVQDFLLKTAFLPVVSVSHAGKLAGARFAEDILSTLNRRNFFTERLSGAERGYRYHPLFKDFLMVRAGATFSAQQLARTKRKAARLLEQGGRTEDAARLYADAGDWDGLVRIITLRAGELLAQGRSETVEEWIAAIPEGMVEANPWLLYWTGMCSFPADMARARRYLEKALASHKARGDAPGAYISWAGIVDTYSFDLGEWQGLDRCLEIFEDLGSTYHSALPAEIDLIVSSRMLLSLILRKIDKSEAVLQWYERVSALLKGNPSIPIQMDTMFYMSIYYLWKGEYHKNAILLEKAADIPAGSSPMIDISIKLMRGIHCWITAAYDDALKVLSEGLEVSEKSGVHIYDSLLWSFKAASEMAPGNMEAARFSLQNQRASLVGKEKTLDSYFCHINAAWYCLLAGNPSLATEHLETISATVTKMGALCYRALWHIGMAQAAFARMHAGDAATHVKKAHRIARAMKSPVMEWYSLLVEAYLSFAEGNEKQGSALLGRALSLGRDHGYVHLEFYQPEMMRFLCAKALQAGTKTEYVKGLIAKLKLAPPQPGGGRWASQYPLAEQWPYPLKIYTLGRFQVVRYGRPLDFSGKVQKKPLEMLKAIIAFGGADVPEESVSEALWPDTEGNLAHKSFETTLSRLRKLFGEEGYLLYSAGRVSLDGRSSWVDSIFLDQELERMSHSPAEVADRFVEEIVALYRGPFLPSESALGWSGAMRETLKDKLARAVIDAGLRREQGGDAEGAVDLYLRGLGVDDLTEEFYRRLMICYQRLGRKADAIKTYRRCRSLLDEKLGTGPSPATEAIYSGIT